MKILKFILLLFVCSYSFAQSDKISPIPLPQGIFLDIDIQKCDIVCIQDILDEERYFSFLSKYDDSISTKALQEEYLIYGQMFNVFLVDVNTGNIRIAILVPQKTIRRYALTSVNTAIAYLIRQSNEFEVRVFNSGDESEVSLKNSLNQIRLEGFSHIIAPVTQEGAKIIIENSLNLNIYIPTLHSSLFYDIPTNVVFGGINYEEQIEALSPFSNIHAVLFSDGSKLGDSLDDMARDDDKIIVAKATFGSARNDYKGFFKDNRNINASSIYFNTPLVTTSLLASQTRAYKHIPYSMLSTQINYSPMLLTLTQPEDRVNFFIASSIGNIEDELWSINSIFGQDLEYDWVNYATSIGVEYFSTRFFDSAYPKIFNEDIINSQVNYQTRIFKAGKAKFILQDDNSDFLFYKGEYDNTTNHLNEDDEEAQDEKMPTENYNFVSEEDELSDL